MRKASSFMCVLVVLLAGGAEAQRPLASERVLAALALAHGVHHANAWGSDMPCRRMDEIYANGEELCNTMFSTSFKYETDESKAYTMWWFEGGAPGTADALANPNDAITGAIGTHAVPDTCGLAYSHKTAVTPESGEFTECHPWHGGSCCHDATVNTVDTLKYAYGPEWAWNRCGPMSQACERFFVQEACFYECEPNAGLYRRFTDEHHAGCDGQAVGHVLPSGYTCTGDENRWEMYQMPIKASYCDSWYTACQADRFCGSGDFWACASSYNNEVALNATLQAWAAGNASSAIAALEATSDALSAAEAEAKKEKLPGWAVAVIIVCVLIALALFAFVCLMAKKEKQGKPIFHNMEAEKAQPQA